MNSNISFSGQEAKTEHMELLEKLKEEQYDDYQKYLELRNTVLRDHDYCKNPKLEVLMEPKLEETKYFEMNRPSEISTETAIFDFTNSVKLEPVNEINVLSVKNPIPKPTFRRCSVCSAYSENLISTRIDKRKLILMLGSVLSGQNTIEVAKTTLRSCHIYTCPSHFPETVNEIFKVLSIDNIGAMRWCSIDNVRILMQTVNELSPEIIFSKFHNDFIDFTKRADSARCIKKGPTGPISKDRKLVLLVATSVCGWNFVEPKAAIRGIFEALNIENVDEMQSRSTEITDKFMSTVGKRWPDFSYPKFYNSLINVIANDDKEPAREPMEVSIGSQRTLYSKRTTSKLRWFPICSICSASGETETLISIENFDRKSIVLIGSVIGGWKTVEDAQMLISKPVYLCTSHLPEIVDSIFEFLNIESLDAMQTCSNENIQNVMNTVKLLRPELRFVQFLTLLKHFNRFISVQGFRYNPPYVNTL